MKTIAQVSNDTLILQNRLSELSIGEVITYEDLSQLIGTGVQTSPGKGYLTTARKRLLAERVYFGTVRKVGVKRCTNEEIVETCQRGIDSTRRSMNRENKKLVCAEYDQLSEELKTRHNLYVTQFALLHSLTTNNAQKKLEKVVSQTGNILPLQKTLEVFRNYTGE